MFTYLKVKSPYLKTLESFCNLIVIKLNRIGVKGSSVVSLPNKKRKFTVLKSVHVNKKSRDQFEISIYSRLIKISSVTKKEMFFLLKDKPPMLSIYLLDK